MSDEMCDNCNKVYGELKTFNIVNIETKYVVAIIELCFLCVDEMEKEGRLTAGQN